MDVRFGHLADLYGRIPPNKQIFNRASVIPGEHNYQFGGQLCLLSSIGFNSLDVRSRGIVGAGDRCDRGIGPNHTDA